MIFGDPKIYLIDYINSGKTRQNRGILSGKERVIIQRVDKKNDKNVELEVIKLEKCHKCENNAKYYCFECKEPICGQHRSRKPVGYCNVCIHIVDRRIAVGTVIGVSYIAYKVIDKYANWISKWLNPKDNQYS